MVLSILLKVVAYIISEIIDSIIMKTLILLYV